MNSQLARAELTPSTPPHHAPTRRAAREPWGPSWPYNLQPPAACRGPKLLPSRPGSEDSRLAVPSLSSTSPAQTRAVAPGRAPHGPCPAALSVPSPSRAWGCTLAALPRPPCSPASPAGPKENRAARLSAGRSLAELPGPGGKNVRGSLSGVWPGAPPSILPLVPGGPKRNPGHLSGPCDICLHPLQRTRPCRHQPARLLPVLRPPVPLWLWSTAAAGVSPQSSMALRRRFLPLTNPCWACPARPGGALLPSGLKSAPFYHSGLDSKYCPPCERRLLPAFRSRGSFTVLSKSDKNTKNKAFLSPRSTVSGPRGRELAHPMRCCPTRGAGSLRAHCGVLGSGHTRCQDRALPSRCSRPRVIPPEGWAEAERLQAAVPWQPMSCLLEPLP